MIRRLCTLVIVISLIMTTMGSVSIASNASDFIIENGVLIKYIGTDTAIIIPDNVISISDGGLDETGAFFDSKELISVKIPKGVISIDEGVFSHCSSLTEIIVDDINPQFSSEDGVLFNKTKTLLIQCPPSKTGSYIIPNGVTSIGNRAFEQLFSKVRLTSIIIPDGVVSIGDGAFEGCRELTSMIIPDSVTSIGISAFFYCRKMTSITIGKGVTNIDMGAFSACYGLTSVTIPESVTSIGMGAFWNCTGLIAAVFMGDAPELVVGDTITIGVFAECSPKFKVHYISGNTSFTNPWYGYTTTTETFVPDPFKDLDDVEWALSAIINLSKANIINGYDDGTFRPSNNITRAEFVKMLVVAFDIYNPEATSNFIDLPDGAWYNTYVASAESEGLAKGSGDGKFSPDSYITREEMFIFCARAINSYKSYEMLNSDSPEVVTELNKFTDGSDVSDWAREYVASITICGLVIGTPFDGGHALFPQNSITRAEVAVVLDRALQLGSMK